MLNVDPETRPADFLPAARLTIAWEACKKRAEVETEANAQRAVNRLPVQLAIDDWQSARDAFERAQGKTFPDHKVPSENYFEKKVGEVETYLKAEKLSAVTSFAQEERQRTPGATPGALRNRFEVMGAMLEMLKARYMANPVLATASLALMKECSVWLCGENV